MPVLTKRHEFVLLFDVTNGNPNGDPDSGNQPRLDPDTSHGLVTDVCLKRKIRNYVSLFHGDDPRFGIYLQDGAILNRTHRAAYQAARPGEAAVATAARLSPRDEDEAAAVRRFMCDHFFDVRAFGAVMSTGVNCGQVLGPVQLAFAQSLEPIVPQELTITRMAATEEAEERSRKKAWGKRAGDGRGAAVDADADPAVEAGRGAEEDERRENRTMGRKHRVPYALYRVHGFVSAKQAERGGPGGRPRKAEGTGFDEADLDLLWTALERMFDHDRSAARGEMASQRLVVFRHDSALGNASAASLFRRVAVRRHVRGAVYDLDSPELDTLPPARRFEDYDVRIDHTDLPAGVEMIERF
ncbi:type I-C CRISPR-associated protein Cas7/Csd2 [Azospirillum doebereinerae]|uniref:type I-C CRISPR-associated protein Cas7/Csd2 n=1 Tax=Azospirillum doebereinerae TaxID=92933 RepID=UPI001EE5EA19|nr:type I-C CRISPR-associated protein Cas7/Csd2 [Azospirillum doebereinerae]MCG5243867.1 type I-C CRISPR-associated protein Cas7/Csd2 [Azospirillum doebereinerae]